MICLSVTGDKCQFSEAIKGKWHFLKVKILQATQNPVKKSCKVVDILIFF